MHFSLAEKNIFMGLLSAMEPTASEFVMYDGKFFFDVRTHEKVAINDWEVPDNFKPGYYEYFYMSDIVKEIEVPHEYLNILGALYVCAGELSVETRFYFDIDAQRIRAVIH